MQRFLIKIQILLSKEILIRNKAIFAQKLAGFLNKVASA